ncbi:MAG TPA: cation-translocating P-type ATPase [Myxococcota bacterium]|nr:cation-translocating P-type ATPase [Myxococcota bacterium]
MADAAAEVDHASAATAAATAGAEAGLFLDGLRCAGCVGRVEKALRALPGVEEAAVNYTSHRARVRFDPARADVGDLVRCVAELGYEAVPYDPAALDRPAERSARDALVRVLVAAFLAGNVMWLAAALYIGAFEGIDEVTRRGLRWLAVGLSLPAATWCAAPFWRGALSGLRRREITIDVPVALGIAVAFGVSAVGTWLESDDVYVDSAAMIVFLVLLGRTLERRARAKASGAVEQLAALAPETARRRRSDGSLETVAVEALGPGDLVVVAPGEAVPADGIVRLGDTELDEALLTGESFPVARRCGDAVAGGSRNLSCEIEIEVTAGVREGTLARLVSLLERAQTEKPRIQRLVDRVAAVFAPTVLALAAVVAAVWAARGAAPLEVALTTAAVLIVACPCALGLATPAAVTAALGRAAALGVLFKSGDALERCARVDRVILDKTGTLTEGVQRVERIEPAAGFDAKEVLAAAAAAEGASLHPVAAAIRRAAEEAGLAVAERAPRSNRPGLGVVAGEGEARAVVGSRALLDAFGLAPDAALARAADGAAAQGLSLAFVAEGSTVRGWIALSDAPRPDAAAAVARLEALVGDVRLVSGDHAEAVRLAAERTGIATSEAGVSPEAKVDAVRALRAGGGCVLVAGDGINDAAALAAADVGVAMARGADVALHAADVVVRSPHLEALPDALELSRATVRRIRQNLVLAVGYNVVAIPLAATGVLTPLWAALAMSLSSVVVTANSVRLLRWQRR